MTEFFARAIVIGLAATLVLDVWNALLRLLFKITPPSMGMVGRWIGHFPRGRFAHAKISDAAPVAGEQAIGWIAHYAIGVGFALLFLAIVGLDWARQPTLLPALVFGVVTVAAPFLVMQPAMGAGVAASKTPNPPVARVRSLVSHAVFGIGLYAAALALQLPISTR